MTTSKKLTSKQLKVESKENKTKRQEKNTPNLYVYNEEERKKHFIKKLQDKNADVEHYIKLVEMLVFFEKKFEQWKNLDEAGEETMSKIVVSSSNYASLLQKFESIKGQEEVVDFKELL